MLKELNQTFAALCSVAASTAQAVEDGSKILRIKGAAAKQITAIEAVAAIEAAKQNCSQEQLTAAAELLALVDKETL